ncbi:MAG: PEP-CTERM sorting domain-containing protein [Verrucomicrobiaceae bacterium]|nr:MAG: PEP-CTERM sorting domain-containing protein [Verrucomicrobiaceae bacterium]
MSRLFVASASIAALACHTASAALTTPYLENFSDATVTVEANATTTLTYKDITYSVDGNGKMGVFDLPSFLGTSYSSISGLGILGDFVWTGATTNNVHDFTMSADGGVKFRLASLDAVTGNSGPPTIFTITAYSGATQTAQITGLDLATLTSTTYGALTSNSVDAVNIGPGDDSGYGQSLLFTGSGWQSVDRIVFTTTGNDLLLGLDNIQFANPIPEPSALVISMLGLIGTLAIRRRR